MVAWWPSLALFTQQVYYFSIRVLAEPMRYFRFVCVEQLIISRCTVISAAMLTSAHLGDTAASYVKTHVDERAFGHLACRNVQPPERSRLVPNHACDRLGAVAQSKRDCIRWAGFCSYHAAPTLHTQQPYNDEQSVCSTVIDPSVPQTQVQTEI